MMGKNRRMTISDKYCTECVIFHRSVNDVFPRVEVTLSGVVGIANESGEICEPLPLFVGDDPETQCLNAKVIKVMSDAAKELGMTLFYRPTLGLSEDDEARRAVEGEHPNQRRARKARERVMKWKGRTHGDVKHISTANREKD